VTASPLPPTAPATLRVVPAPDWEPPYSDSRWPADGAPMHGQSELALTFVLPGGLPAEPAPALRLVPVRGDAQDPDAFFGPQPTPAVELPDPRVWAGRLAQAVAEVVGGDRPAPQLLRWTSGEVYALVCRQAAVARMRGTTGRAVARVGRAEHPTDGVAEVSATVTRRERTTALALRLEGLDGRWRCTELVVG